MGGQRLEVVGAADPFPVGQRLLVQADGVVVPARLLVGVGEVVAGGQRLGSVRSQDPFPVGQRPFVQADGLLQPARLLVGVGEVVAGGQRVGVVGTADLLPDGQRPFVQADGLLQPARRPVGVSEVVAGGQRVGMVGAQDQRPLGQRPLGQRDRECELPLLPEVDRGAVTQPCRVVSRAVAAAVENGANMRQQGTPPGPDLRVAGDIAGQVGSEQPKQGGRVRLLPIRRQPVTGGGLHQPVHVHRVLIPAGQAVPDQRPDRVRPHRPTGGRVLQRPVVEPCRIPEQIEGDRLRGAQRPQFQQFHRGRALIAQPAHGQLPQHRDGDPRPIGHLPFREHVAEILGEEFGVLLWWGAGLVEIAGGLLDRQRQVPQQVADLIRDRRIQRWEPVGEDAHRFGPWQQRHGDRCAESGEAPPPRGHQQPARPW